MKGSMWNEGQYAHIGSTWNEGQLKREHDRYTSTVRNKVEG